MGDLSLAREYLPLCWAHTTGMKDGGFHRPADNLGRVVMDRLPEGVEILTRLLRSYDQQSFLGNNKTKG
jgi:hypothetical protein